MITEASESETYINGYLNHLPVDEDLERLEMGTIPSDNGSPHVLGGFCGAKSVDLLRNVRFVAILV
jgi:hypothetical protein